MCFLVIVFLLSPEPFSHSHTSFPVLICNVPCPRPGPNPSCNFTQTSCALLNSFFLPGPHKILVTCTPNPFLPHQSPNLPGLLLSAYPFRDSAKYKTFPVATFSEDDLSTFSISGPLLYSTVVRSNGPHARSISDPIVIAVWSTLRLIKSLLHRGRSKHK